jgi:LemA protein
VLIPVVGTLAAASIAAGAYFSKLYYGDVQVRIDLERAWTKLDALLVRRRAALETLLDTAESNGGFRPGVLSEAARLRSQTPAAGAVPERFEAESKLSVAIGKVLATAQNYPALARDAHYKKLEERLLDLEEEIERRRERYNEQVALNNARCTALPDRFAASLAGLEPRESFPGSPADDGDALGEDIGEAPRIARHDDLDRDALPDGDVAAPTVGAVWRVSRSGGTRDT